MSEEKLNNLSREEAIKLLDNQIDYTYKLNEEIQHLVDPLNSRDNEYEYLKQENQQLLETSKAYKKLLKTTMQKEHQAIKLLDEIREHTKIGITTYQNGGSRTAMFEVFDTINEILDKVKE